MPAGGDIKPALKVPRVNLRVHERHELERPAAAKGPEEDRPPERPARAQDARRTRVIIIISAAGGARPSPHRGHIEDIMQARRTSRRTSKAYAILQHDLLRDDFLLHDLLLDGFLLDDLLRDDPLRHDFLLHGFHGKNANPYREKSSCALL